MKQIVQSLRSSQAQRQGQIARILIVLGLSAAWGHMAGHSMGLSNQSASALTPISILALVAGFALAALTRQELKACLAQQQAAAEDTMHVSIATRRLQLIHGSRTADPQH
ncbi:hypothetical protein [Curvibacter gracilis]|uniref:hypothetical protein n=1 Tax=Curvibacter gracilis TaxID=230310 RepID=UPI0004B95F7D|nr:hypothetical protein [Curvibacter gracilis]